MGLKLYVSASIHLEALEVLYRSNVANSTRLIVFILNYLTKQTQFPKILEFTNNQSKAPRIKQKDKN